MTNQLFRDYLDGLIPAPAKPNQLTTAEAMQRFADAVGVAVNEVISDFAKIAEAFAVADLQSSYTLSPPSHTEARANALAHQRHRSTGPTPEPLRTRGRNNHYRTKG